MIDTVNIGSKQRPVKLGMNALRKFTKDVGITLSEFASLGADIDLDGAIRLIYHALLDGARKEGQEFTATIEEVSDWLDEAGKFEEVFTIVMDQYSAGDKSGNPKKAKPKS